MARIRAGGELRRLGQRERDLFLKCNSRQDSKYPLPTAGKLVLGACKVCREEGELPMHRTSWATATLVEEDDVTFDHYGSLADPNLRIFVANDAVPPFRFKAGGWELLTSSIDLGPAMKTRIAENGYFLCSLNDERSGWTELTHP